MLDAQLLGRDAGRFVERPGLEVARRQRAEAVEGQQIRRGAQLPVLRRRRTERALREIATELGQLARMCPLAILRPADGNRLDALAAEHRTTAAATGMPPVVRDGRVAHSPLSRWTDRGDAIVSAEPSAQLLLRDLTRVAEHIVGRLESNVSIVDDQHRPVRGASDDDDRVGTRPLSCDRETTARERIVEALGQRTLADDRKLGRCGERATDERAERKDERRLGRQRIRGRTTLVEKQPRTETAAPEVLTKNGV